MENTIKKKIWKSVNTFQVMNECIVAQFLLTLGLNFRLRQYGPIFNHFDEAGLTYKFGRITQNNGHYLLRRSSLFKVTDFGTN